MNNNTTWYRFTREHYCSAVGEVHPRVI